MFRKIFKGASHYEVTTKSGGELIVPLFTPRDRMAAVGNMAFRQHRGTKWLVFPEPQRMYTFYVGAEAHNVAVPWDFGMEDVLVKQHFSQYEDFGDFIRAMHEQGRLVMNDDGIVIKTGIELKPGEDCVQF